MRRVTWPVNKRAMVTGDTVRADDIALVDTTIVWPWNSTPDTTRAVAGWIARRPIAIGEVLRVPAIMAPPLVSAGAPVTAIWQDGSLRLVLSGVALNTAPLGAPVGVRIDHSRRLDGVAIAPNTVRLR
jgi:flagella basal body P-ring formation protein FlgA